MEGRPFTILGINTDNDRATLVAGVKKHNLTWPIMHDGPPKEGVSHQWFIRSYPTAYFIDHEGIIRFENHRGGASLNELVQKAADSMKKQP